VLEASAVSGQFPSLSTGSARDLQILPLKGIFAVPLEAGQAGLFSPGHSTHQVVYESITKSAILPFKQGLSYSLRAFTLTFDPLNPTVAPGLQDASTGPPPVREHIPR
jgi:hypothetical protein